VSHGGSIIRASTAGGAFAGTEWCWPLHHLSHPPAWGHRRGHRAGLRRRQATQTVLLVLYAFACTLGPGIGVSPARQCVLGRLPSGGRNFELTGYVVLRG
jgi:hypothetical protein